MKFIQERKPKESLMTILNYSLSLLSCCLMLNYLCLWSPQAQGGEKEELLVLVVLAIKQSKIVKIQCSMSMGNRGGAISLTHLVWYPGSGVLLSLPQKRHEISVAFTTQVLVGLVLSTALQYFDFGNMSSIDPTRSVLFFTSCGSYLLLLWYHASILLNILLNLNILTTSALS